MLQHDAARYCATSFAWAGVWLAIGYVLGRTVQFHVGAIMFSRTDAANRRDVLLGVFLIVLAVATTVFYVQQRHDRNCSFRQSELVNQRTIAFSQYASEDRDALRRYIQSIDSRASDIQREVARKRLLATYDKTEAARAERPLPTLESACP